MLRGKNNVYSASFAVFRCKDNINGEQESSTTMLIIVVYYKIPLVEMLKASRYGNFSAPM